LLPWHTRHKRIPPGSAKPLSRAAMFIPSPKKSPSSTAMSPKLMPIRNSMRLSAGTFAFRSAIPRCNGLVHRSITLRNWTRKPSPVVLTSRPLCAVILGSNSSTRLESRKPRGRYRTAKPVLKTFPPAPDRPGGDRAL
jgi:hypothetical protein